MDLHLKDENDINISQSKNENDGLINKNENEKITKSVKKPMQTISFGSNIFFQGLMFFNPIFFILYFFVEIISFIVKLTNLKYPSNSAQIELVCLGFFMIFTITRYYIGNLGNKTETSQYILFFLIFSFFTIYALLYYAFMQTYILKIEVIFNCIGFAFNVLEVIGAILTFLSLYNLEINI